VYEAGSTRLEYCAVSVANPRPLGTSTPESSISSCTEPLEPEDAGTTIFLKVGKYNVYRLYGLGLQQYRCETLKSRCIMLTLILFRLWWCIPDRTGTRGKIEDYYKAGRLVFLFCTVTNKCTIISQIITLLHVSTLSCRDQGACDQYLAKLHNYLRCSCL